MNDLDERIANLSPAKRALFEINLKQKSPNAAVERAAFPRRVNRDSAPPSFAQQRLWFLDQMEPNSSFYNVTEAVRISGLLNVEALQKRLARLFPAMNLCARFSK